MPNTSEWSSPGDYHITELSMTLYDGSKIDISGNVLQLEIFEDIHSPMVTGLVMFKDTTSYLETYKFNGSEKLNVKFTTSRKDDFLQYTKTFIVSKLSDVMAKGKEMFYTLHLTTPITVIDKNYKISKSYDDKAENIIKNIYKHTLGLEANVACDNTKHPRKFVAPKVSPITLFKYLADTSISEHSDNGEDTGFVFFENSVGHNFRYLKGMYEDTAPFTIYEKDKNSDVSGIDRLNVVIDSYIPVMYDNTTNIVKGAFGNTVMTHDIINKKVETFKYGYSGTLTSDSDRYSHNNRFSFMSSNYDNETSNKWGLTSDANKSLFDNFKISVTMFGNSSITVGETVKYTQKTNIFTDEISNHKVFPTKFLITNVKHTISNGIYMQTLELCSDRWVYGE